MSEKFEPEVDSGSTENHVNGNGADEPKNVASLADFRKKKEELKVLQNFTVIGNGKKSENIGIGAIEIREAMQKIMGPWPKRVGNKLFALSNEGRVIWLNQASVMIGWLSAHGVAVNWSERAPGALTKTEFFNYLQTHAEQRLGIAELPHFPPVDGYHYDHPAIDNAMDDGSFDKLLSFFKPATPTDTDLLKAAFMTLFWGGRGGSRPIFVISSKAENTVAGGGRGVGKTILTDLMAELAGGLIDLSHRTKDFESIRKRILTSNGERIVRLDNIKDTLSHADLESMATSQTISGHLMYVGNAAIPNTFTYIMTLNEPDMSKDMAQRAIMIRLDRPDYFDAWEETVSLHIRKHRWQIIAGIKRALEAEPIKSTSQLRFANWSGNVLMRVTKDPEIIDKIKTDQRTADMDEDRADEISQVISYQLSKYRVGSWGQGENVPTDQTKMTFAIRRSLVHQWVAQALKLGTRSPRVLGRLVGQADIPQLEEIETVRKGYSYYLWKPSEGGPAEKALVVFEDSTACKIISKSMSWQPEESGDLPKTGPQ